MQTGWQWCYFKCFLGADASPCFLVHYLVWAHPWGLAKHHQCYKHFVQCLWSSVLPRLVRKPATTTNPPPRCSGSGPRQKEPSIFSTSFTIWCVVYRQVWNSAENTRTSFNSLRRCEVWCFITGARETVTVTLAVPSYYSLCHVKVRWCVL